MKIDVNRVAAAAIDAALHGDEPARRHRVPGGRLILTGAALATAARVGQKQMSGLTKLRLVARGLSKLEDLPNLRDVGGAVRDRFDDLTHRDAYDIDDALPDDVDEEDWDDEDEDDEDDEDEDDEDEDDDDEDEDDGPRGDARHDEDEDDEDDEDDEEDDAPADDEPVAEDEPDDQPRDEDVDHSDDVRGDSESDADDEEPSEEEAEPPRLRTEAPDLVGAFGSSRRGSRIVQLASKLSPAGRPPEPVRRATRK